MTKMPCNETTYRAMLGNVSIIPPRMMAQSAGRSTAAPRCGGMGGRVGRGARRTREPVRRNNETIGELDGQGNDRGVEENKAQVGSKSSNQGNDRNQNSDAVNDNIQGNVRNVIVNNDRWGCTYKEFLACNPKEYDGNGGAIVYTRWIKKIELVQDMSGCRDNQKVNYITGSFVGKALTWWNSQIHTRSREVTVEMSWEDFKNLTRHEFCPVNEMQKLEITHLVTPENKRIKRYIYGLAPQIRKMVAATEPSTIQKAMQKAGTLIDEAIRNGSLKKNTEKRGNGGEHSRDRNVKDDNKRSRTGNAFATTANPVRREYTGTVPKCTNCNLHHLPELTCRACFSCNRLGHLAKDCRVVPRMVNPVNARNPTAARGACFECGGTDHFKATCPRLNQAQRLGGGRPNQVVAIDGGQGRRNNGNRARIESSNLGFSYKIEIANEHLVEIDKVIRGCELEIEGHTYDIDVIPFGSRSFDVIVGMD
ncbi:reverse transcriptase domain-containing protein [Tanacetum coccineum]